MSEKKIFHHLVIRARPWKSAFSVMLLFSLAIPCYYLLVSGPEQQQRERIQHLVESGLSVEASIKFDERFCDQVFRWPWQEIKPYDGDEVKFAEMWLYDNITTEVLLNFYYCTSSNYYSLVWLLGSLKKGVSYWENAVGLVVHGDASSDGISNYDSLLGPTVELLGTFVPNPVTVYALTKDLPKEVVMRLKPFEIDGRMTEDEKIVVNLISMYNLSETRRQWVGKNLEANPATRQICQRATLSSRLNQRI